MDEDNEKFWLEEQPAAAASGGLVQRRKAGVWLRAHNGPTEIGGWKIREI